MHERRRTSYQALPLFESVFLTGSNSILTGTKPVPDRYCQQIPQAVAEFAPSKSVTVPRVNSWPDTPTESQA